MPARRGDELSNPVLADLLAAQVAVRSAADIVDDQSLMLAWPWALVIACLSWTLATMVRPGPRHRRTTAAVAVVGGAGRYRSSR
jgi:hypothetical protein